MKAFALLLSLILIMGIYACRPASQEAETGAAEETVSPEEKLQGTWQGILVMNGEDTVWNEPEAFMYKYFIGDRFAFAHFDERDQSFSGTGGGLFTADDEVFSEHMEYNSYDTTQVDKSFTFTYSLKGDTLIQEGVIETMDDSIYPIHEKYVRIERFDSLYTPIQGIWKYRLGRYDNETKLKQLAKDVDALCVFTPGQFFVVHYDTIHNRFIGITGGDYTLRDSIYTEIIRYNSRDTTAVGHKFEFIYSRDEETFHKSGYMDSEKYPNLFIEEVYTKY